MFTMETLFAAAFGRAIDIQRGQSDELNKSALQILFKSALEGNKTSMSYLIMVLSKDDVAEILSRMQLIGLSFLNRQFPMALGSVLIFGQGKSTLQGLLCST